MKYFFNVLLGLSTLIALAGTQQAYAQVNTGTTTTTSQTDITKAVPAKADDISDAQLRDMIQKAKASGLSDEQIRKAAIAKGMPEAEAAKLQTRIDLIRTPRDVKAADDKKSADREVQTDAANKAGASTGIMVGAGGLPIFGSELFSNSNLTFEPNLRIATPQNYRLGPDDQLVINVYGNSQVDWQLKITPDGNIQIPGIGLVNVSGKTIEQATGLIKSKLIANHYAIGSGTSVAVSLGNIRSIKVTLVGEIVKPATYTLSSLSNVFNALYTSGGPNINGSFRQIEIIRNNMLIGKLDAYDYLLRANQKDNIRLQDGDIIRVPTYKVRVGLSGQVKRQAIYEVLPGETLSDVINFAGGFTDAAYTATVKATQVTNQDLKVVDINANDFGNYIPLRGDFYTVDKILDTYENRVSIYGAVVRAGQFELVKGLTLSQLIVKAAGLRPDAFSARGFVSRIKADNTTELIPFDVKGVVNKTSPDILLKKEDVVSIPSIFDLRDQYTVTINGEVRGAGQFPFSANMSVEDLIVQAGGLTEAASSKRIEVARRINTGNPNLKNAPVANISIINIDENFKVGGKSFILQPFDVVSVYTLPGYENQRTVRVEGEVIYPGNYTLRTKNEKISDLVKRAGGLTVFADAESGTLKRVNILGIDSKKQKIDSAAYQQEKFIRIQHIKRTLRDSTTVSEDQFRNELVGIDLRGILVNPGSKIDLILQEGDVLRIPKEQQLVSVNGEVLFPSSVVYDSSKSLIDFVSNAGGFSSDALRRRAYVIYANGAVKATHNFLFVKFYPKVKAGSEIIIPKRPPVKALSILEFSTIIGALTSAAAVLIGIVSISRR